jgi:hypothetical protein
MAEDFALLEEDDDSDDYYDAEYYRSCSFPCESCGEAWDDFEDDGYEDELDVPYGRN